VNRKRSSWSRTQWPFVWPGVEVGCVAVGVGHVVPVRQEDVPDPAQRFEPPHQRGDELRRVDQPVARRVPDEVAVAAIRLRRVVAAVVHRPLDREREVVHHGLHVVVAETADGPGGARKESLQGDSPVGRCHGLGFDERRVRCLAKHGRGDLPTGVAVDAGRVHEEVAGSILQDSLAGVYHGRTSLPQFYAHCPELRPPAGSHPQVKWKRRTSGPGVGPGDQK
jgi:hypothetical protein